MKKLFVLTLAVLMVLGLFAGCQPAESSSPESNYTISGKFKETNVTTVTPGKLTVAISPDFAPMEFVDPTKMGQDMYVGFDVILANFIADELGLELVIMPMSFDACQTAVYTAAVDMSISGFSRTADREANANLSDYYYAGENENEQVLITLKANAGKYTTAESLKGVKVGAQNASLQQALVEAQLPDSTLELYTDLGTAVLQLKNGDFACMAVADGNADAIIANNPDIVKSGFSFYVDPKETGNVILLPKASTEMTNIVNQILAESEQYWDAWYKTAESISGIDQSYDDDGNVVTEGAE